jgi:hypothetical protein
MVPSANLAHYDGRKDDRCNKLNGQSLSARSLCCADGAMVVQSYFSSTTSFGELWFDDAGAIGCTSPPNQI